MQFIYFMLFSGKCLNLAGSYWGAGEHTPGENCPVGPLSSKTPRACVRGQAEPLKIHKWAVLLGKVVGNRQKTSEKFKKPIDTHGDVVYDNEASE